jgi:hypothetical protein
MARRRNRRKRRFTAKARRAAMRNLKKAWSARRKHRGRRGKRRGKRRHRKIKVKASVVRAYGASIRTSHSAASAAEDRAKREAAVASHRAEYLARLRKRLAEQNVRHGGSYASSGI